MRVHFGLGSLEQVSIAVQLSNRTGVVSYPDLQANRLWHLNLADKSASEIHIKPLVGN